MRIKSKAFAKINWALDILGRRSDGYHELDMLMQSITLCDELYFENDRELSLSVDGHLVPSDDQNLMLQAAKALMDYSGKKKGARMKLMKNIPSRAGLGGGSSDCAATLIALNKLWRLGLPMKTLIKIGAGLGADVPFCLSVGLARVGGIGEKINYLEPSASFPLLIVLSGSGLSTREVFEAWDLEEKRGLDLDMDAAQQALVQGDLKAFAAVAGNALEKTAIRMMPAIWEQREKLYTLGAAYARMSGSGSAVFGVFEDIERAKEAKGALGAKAMLAWTHSA
jgi:4-diphosphocytidyl-2-C-methyl-D-erythritol kinase